MDRAVQKILGCFLNDGFTGMESHPEYAFLGGNLNKAEEGLISHSRYS